MRRLALIIFFALGYFFSAKAQSVQDLPCSYPEHTKPRHKGGNLVNVQGVKADTSRIKLTGVYMIIDTITDVDKQKRARYSFYRFFLNGSVYDGTEYYCFPDSASLNDLHHGIYGYYRVENDSTLEMEFWTAWAGYVYGYYRIEPNSFVKIYSKRWSGEIDPEPDVLPPLRYTFYKYKLTSSQLSW